jgi:hypothetical protein
MNYSGNLYGKIGKKYFPMEKTSDDIDNEISALKQENETLRNSINKPDGMITLSTLFEIQTFHGNEAMISAVTLMLDDYKKLITYPVAVSANNGDDIVYIHEDGHTTWNKKE